MTPAVQREFSLRKGSLPAHKSVPLHDFPSCARQSATAFQAAAHSQSLVPALGTALSADQEEALRQLVSEFWNDERVTPRHLPPTLHFHQAGELGCMRARNCLPLSSFRNIL